MNKAFIIPGGKWILSAVMYNLNLLMLSGSVLIICIFIRHLIKQQTKYRSPGYTSIQKIRKYRLELEKAAKDKASKKGIFSIR